MLEEGGGGYNVKTLQHIAILTSYITFEGYSAMTLQPIAIVTSYIGEIQHKTSISNSNFNSLQHIWEHYSVKHQPPIAIPAA